MLVRRISDEVFLANMASFTISLRTSSSASRLSRRRTIFSPKIVA